jgi:FAD:protein FMN transferase
MTSGSTTTRRQLLLGGGALLAGWALPLRGAAARATTSPLRLQRPMMGTVIGITMVGEPALLAPAAEAAYAEMARLAAMMSHYRPTSVTGAINLAAGLQAVSVPRELLQVLQAAQAVARLSHGAFDATVGSVGRWHFDPAAPAMPTPQQVAHGLGRVDWRQLVLDEAAGTARLARRGMRLDLGGIAKLPILQAGLDMLRAHGIETALIDGGGDVLGIAAPGTRPWRVGIRDPRAPQRLAATVELTRGVIASSGDYERCFERDGRRYHHVLDPRTGYPARGPHGVTLVAESVEAVNGIGTAAMVMAPDDGREWLGGRGVDALVGGRDGQLWMTPGMRRRMIAG